MFCNGYPDPLHQQVSVKERADKNHRRHDDSPSQPDLELHQVLHDRHFFIFERLKDRVLQPLLKLEPVSHEYSRN